MFSRIFLAHKAVFASRAKALTAERREPSVRRALHRGAAFRVTRALHSLYVLYAWLLVSAAAKSAFARRILLKRGLNARSIYEIEAWDLRDLDRGKVNR